MKLGAEPEVLADAVLGVGEALSFAGAQLSVEMEEPRWWFGEGPPEPLAALTYRRGEETRRLQGLGTGEIDLIDGLRVQHRWSELRDRVWVHVTDTDCPSRHDQEEGASRGAPLWVWLSSRGLRHVSLGHAHTAKLTVSSWYTPQRTPSSPPGPRIAIQGNDVRSRANLWATAELREGADVALAFGRRRLRVEEVLVGAAPVHRGGEVGAPPTPVTHARLRFELAESAPPPPSFPRGEGNPCGSPSPERAAPTRLVDGPSSVGSSRLAAGESVVLGALRLAMREEAEPSGGSFSEAPAEPARTRAIVEVQLAGDGGESAELRSFPALLRAGESVVWVSREPGSASAATGEPLRVDAYRASCAAEVRVPMPSRPTLLWLGTGGHTQVIFGAGEEGEESGPRVGFELRREDDGAPRVVISSSTPGHGTRLLSFEASPDADPIAIDTGAAIVIGNWEVLEGAVDGATGRPRWYAVGIPYVPHAS